MSGHTHARAATRPAPAPLHAAAPLLPAAALLAAHALTALAAGAGDARPHSVSAHLHAGHGHAHEHGFGAQHARFHEYGGGAGSRMPGGAEAAAAATLLGVRGAWAAWRVWGGGGGGDADKRRLSVQRAEEMRAGAAPSGWAEAALAGLQTVSYVVAARAGVVRSTALLLVAPTLATPETISFISSGAALLFMAALCILQAVANHDGFGAVAMVVLAATTAALTALSAARSSRDARTRDERPFALLASGLGLAGMVLFRPPLAASTWIPLVALVACLAPYIPFTSAAPGLTLAALAISKVFILPPSPPASDFLLLVPAVVLSWRSAPASFSFPQPSASVGVAITTAHQTWYSPYILVPPSWRPHLATILRTPTSRKIFGFLCLNLVYMGVQMAYGVITNSLGLISDAIHMAFDCLGLAVGLWASVAATWKPDGQYTFGYARVETLSGFANGCFLILISIFIIIEGIQRIMDPPEMETRQLLLVSSIGLAINLFGMWATGGHHHHGHGHSHGHGHGDDHANGHGHSHSHAHAHDHDCGHDHTHARTHAHTNGSALGIVHDKKHDDHAHVHTDCAHDHGHDHAQGHDGEHKHEHGHGHAHDHDDHGHSHGDHGHSHDDHSHSHGHSHGHSHNMRGVFLHVMADTLGSVGVILSTILIRWTGWTGWDPLASLFIAALILASVLPLVTDAARVLALDAQDLEGDVRAALTRVKAVEGVESYSAARFWPKGEGLVVGSIHVQVALDVPVTAAQGHSGHGHGAVHKHVDTGKIVDQVEQALKAGIPGLTEVVVQLESDGFCSCMTGGSAAQGLGPVAG